MAKPKKTDTRNGHLGPLLLLGLVTVGVTIAMLLRGTDVALFNPKGLIAAEQHSLMLLIATLLFSIAIPTLALLFFFAWKYRDSNSKATYNPHVHHGKFFIFTLWGIPIAFMVLLASIMWPAAHKLAPQKAISAGTKPLTIQVVALRWKWLFIYPEQNIASVNFVQVPVGTPVQFELTADEAPMSSFWIPHLGGQLYAMTGHVNHLNLMATQTGDYPGSSAEINGAGFAGMKFIARATTKPSFDQWVRSVELSSTQLDSAEYNRLLAPSQYNPAALYATVEPGLYDNLLVKYNGGHNHQGGNQ